MTHRPSVPQAVPKGGFVARLSLEHKLPLVTGALLLFVIIALASAAYREARRSSLQIATERLTTVSSQYQEALQLSTATLRTQVALTASKPAVVEFARTSRSALRDRALDELRYTGPQPEQVLGTELRDGTGRVMLSTAAPSAGLDTIATNDVLPRLEPGDSAVIGTFRLLRDTIVYAVATPVAGAENAYVVRWRRVAGSRRAREATTRLIGTNASMFFGSPGGKYWTDLERVVPEPTLDLSGTRPIQEYTRPDGSRHLASIARIRASPWVFAIDFPMDSVMAPVNRYMARIAWIGVLVLLVGLGIAWLLSRRITVPLRQLREASDAIAQGDYTQRVRIARADELGHLAFAFGSMSHEVQHLRTNLERKVDERTRDLNATLEQLHDAQDALVRKEKLAMLGQLSSGVGHELRNPLGVMTNAVYYLKTVLSAAPEGVQEYLGILQQQITLSDKIVSDLLDFARQKPPLRKPTSVAEVTEAQISRLGNLNGVKIETKLPATLPPVLVDPVQMGQILLNLLTNAQQAIGNKGLIHVRADVAGDRVHVDIEDTGPGIAPENIEKIFEPLFTTKARGIGLGLAVSRTLARANNGDLTATNAAGQGARFRLTLQAAT
jgi:signal transduction histidine kinase